MENSEKNIAEEVAKSFNPKDVISPTLVVDTSIKGVRIVDEQINLKQGTPAQGYYFLHEFTNYANASNLSGIIYDISYIYDNVLQQAKILFRKNVIEVVESTKDFIVSSTNTAVLNKLYVIYNRESNYAFLYNTYPNAIDIRIHGETRFTDSVIIS